MAEALTVEAEWTASERDRRSVVEAGGAVVANIKTDLRLIAWAKATGRYVRIDRRSKWGNPFVIGKHGTRDEVIDRYRERLQHDPEKMKRTGDLAGKVLGCWCHPLRCHGCELIRVISDATTTERDADS